MDTTDNQSFRLSMPVTFSDLVENGVINDRMAEFLQMCVRAGVNLLVAGEDAFTHFFLNALCQSVPVDARLLLVRTPEGFSVPQRDARRFLALPQGSRKEQAMKFRQAAQDMLQAQPDRVVFADALGFEVFHLAEATTLQGPGILCSMQAADAGQVLDNLCLAETVPPVACALIRRTIAERSFALVQTRRLRDGSYKVTAVAELAQDERGSVAVPQIFVYKEDGVQAGQVQGRHLSTGVRPDFWRRFEAAGLTIPPDMFRQEIDLNASPWYDRAEAQSNAVPISSGYTSATSPYEVSRMTTFLQLVPLGDTGIQISPMGAGAWQWGDRMWDYGRGSYTDDDIRAAFEATLASGVTWFDTAEAYGFGRSERIVGGLLRETQKPAIIATKFFPYPWRLAPGQFRRALQNSLERLGLPAVDLYQIHWPLGPRAIETWVTELGRAVNDGLVRAAGVSNYSLEQTQRAQETLGKLGVSLASNQVHYSLLNRKIEKSGLLDYARQTGVTIIAYSPLEKGILTGKYTAANLPKGMVRAQYDAGYLNRVRPLLENLRIIGDRYGRSQGQVALNWLMCKGAVPIPGAKNLRQAQENAGALGWRLTNAEVSELDRVSDLVSMG